MNKSRRDVLQAGAATLAVSLAKSALAQNAPAPAPAAKFTLDACSRNLQWCRTPQELGKAVNDIALPSVDLSVGGPGAHVDLGQVKTALPAFVNGLKTAGVGVRCVSLPVVDADSPGIEAALDAASAAGIGYYNWGAFPYDNGKTLPAQIDALKPRVAKLAKLNEKYRIKGLYQPRQGMVGCLFLDFLPVLQEFDPRYVAFRYDTAATLQPLQQNVALHLTLGAPYIGGVALNDAVVTLDLPVWDQGSINVPPSNLLLPNGGGDNTGNAGGNPLAYGGGGNPLPYHFHPVPTGSGMIDLVLIGDTLKAIHFDGPAEVQVAYPLGGAESGSAQITLPRQEVIGRIKRDRIVIEQAFHKAWGIDIAQPPFMAARERGGAAPAGGRGGRGAGAPEGN